MSRHIAGALCAVGLLGLVAAGCRVSVNAGESEPPPPPAAQPPPPPAAPPPAPPPEPPKRKFSGFKLNPRGAIQLPGPVEFDVGTAVLRPTSEPVLEHVKKYLDAHPEVTKLRIEGHTDTTNDDASNQTLSEQRAMAVTAWLVGKGVDCKRLLAVGFGESKLLHKPELTDAHRQDNRRVDFFPAQKNGKAEGSGPIDGGGKQAGNACLIK
jgi:OOP family OmpA-OmpF porin